MLRKNDDVGIVKPRMLRLSFLVSHFYIAQYFDRERCVSEEQKSVKVNVVIWLH